MEGTQEVSLLLKDVQSCYLPEESPETAALDKSFCTLPRLTAGKPMIIIRVLRTVQKN